MSSAYSVYHLLLFIFLNTAALSKILFVNINFEESSEKKREIFRNFLLQPLMEKRKESRH